MMVKMKCYLVVQYVGGKYSYRENTFHLFHCLYKEVGGEFVFLYSNLGLLKGKSTHCHSIGDQDWNL